MRLGLLVVAGGVLVVHVAGCSSGDSGASAIPDLRGSAAAAGQGASGAGDGGGAGASSGKGGSAGDVCGPCPAFPCFNTLNFQVSSGSDGSAPAISELSVDSPGLSFQCVPAGGGHCAWACQSPNPLELGVHTVTSAPQDFKPSPWTSPPPSRKLVAAAVAVRSPRRATFGSCLPRMPPPGAAARIWSTT
jgi:hypothetical protein